jgi:hypothetical protein
MKTMLLFSTPFGLENNIPEIKKRVVEYVGSRLIKENPDNAPLIELNTAVDSLDKEKIAAIAGDVLETAAVFVIEADDEKFGRTGGNMCILQPAA